MNVSLRRQVARRTGRMMSATTSESNFPGRVEIELRSEARPGVGTWLSLAVGPGVTQISD